MARRVGATVDENGSMTYVPLKHTEYFDQAPFSCR